MPGAYFVTMCTHNRKRTLLNIVGAIHESPENELTQYEECVKKYRNVADRFVEIYNSDEAWAIRESPYKNGLWQLKLNAAHKHNYKLSNNALGGIMKAPIEIAKYMCDTIISEYQPADLPGIKNRYHYIQALFLFAIERYAKLCGDEKYFDYIQEWLDQRIDENGEIIDHHDLLDDMYPSILLLNMYKRTGDTRYKKALDYTIDRLENWKFTEFGSFFHMYKTPNQVWLDGLFMSGLLLTEYGKEYNCPRLFDLMATQAKNMYDHMRKTDTGMYYHAWDCTKQAEWADKETGLSAECWARAMGWVAFALCDMLETIPKEHPSHLYMEKQLAELLDGLTKYQSRENGLWYQIVDKVERPDNWTETSASCLFAYAMHKAARLGIGNVDLYKKSGDAAFEGIMASTTETENGGLVIPNICIGTNVTDYEGYITRPRRDNDNHGTGAFILMCCEFAQE